MWIQLEEHDHEKNWGMPISNMNHGITKQYLLMDMDIFAEDFSSVGSPESVVLGPYVSSHVASLTYSFH